MKKYLALLLALCMVLSMAACSSNAGNENTQPSGDPAGTVGPNVDDGPATYTYTYNYSLSTFPTNWNYFTYQTSTDAEILDYIVDGFYAFDYNDTMDGYAMVPAMATGDPEDVTADYVGQYGIEEGDENLAWKVTLRDDLKWENGDSITAGDFVESAKRLLDPVAQNYRADSLYSGSFIVVNAENYLKQGKYAYTNMVSSDMLDEEYVAEADMVADENGNYTVDGKGVWVNIEDGGNWGSYSLADYNGAGYLAGHEEAWAVLEGAANEEGYVAINAETFAAVAELIACLHGADSVEAYAASAGDYAYVEWEEMGWYGENKPEMDWDGNVGMFALSDTELVYVIEKPLSGFYLKYNMPAYLCHVPTYDALANVDEEGIYTNTYGTSVETTISYGPYKLTEFQKDKHYVLERNENYYGLTEDTYQTTHIDVVLVAEAATRHQMFLQGELDSFGLDAEYMPTYQLSDNTYYYTGASTYAITFNPDMDGLLAAQSQAGDGINKTILTVLEFRMAMSFALDRLAFCLATSPTNNAAFGLYSNLIISDPEAGTAYRTTEPAKDALVQFWGLADDIGDGKLYADKDEAIESITGYNLTKAQELFDVAYDKAIESGLMTENDVIEIKIGLPSTGNFYVNGYEFLVNNYTDAVKGTKLEGKLTFSKDDTIGNAFSDALENNTIDMLFGVGWSGSALDPYGLFQVYVDPSYQYDAGIDYSTDMLTININGKDLTTDMCSWYDIMNGTACDVKDADGNTISYSCGSADNDPEARLVILAAMEQQILTKYDFIPIMDSSSATLKGMQIQYYTEEYIFGMGFGGMKYYTYNYTDAEWAEYVASCGGTLDYT